MFKFQRIGGTIANIHQKNDFFKTGLRDMVIAFAIRNSVIPTERTVVDIPL